MSFGTARGSYNPVVLYFRVSVTGRFVLVVQNGVWRGENSRLDNGRTRDPVQHLTVGARLDAELRKSGEPADDQAGRPDGQVNSPITTVSSVLTLLRRALPSGYERGTLEIMRPSLRWLPMCGARQTKSPAVRHTEAWRQLAAIFAEDWLQKLLRNN